MKKNFFYLSVFICLLFGSCVSSLDSNGRLLNPDGIETSYCSQKELSLRESGYYFFASPDEWRLQYPSGSEEGGMLDDWIKADFKNKYLSIYINADGERFLRFSLDASDKGKSKNGSSVRAELRHNIEWTLADEKSMEYTFYMTSTDFSSAKFTVGQFLQHCDLKDSPLCRIELENGGIKAVVTNYEKDGKTKADGKSHRYDLGSIAQFQKVKIKISVSNNVLRLYRDGVLYASHNFHRNVRNDYKNYFKLGIYYQNTDSPKIFSEVFVTSLKVQ